MGDVGRTRKRVATHTHSRLQSCTYTDCMRVRSRVQTEGLARGYLSVTRWQAYAPDSTSNGVVRGAGCAEAGCVGHNFQIYVQMFLSRARTGCGACSSWGRCLS